MYPNRECGTRRLPISGFAWNPRSPLGALSRPLIDNLATLRAVPFETLRPVYVCFGSDHTYGGKTLDTLEQRADDSDHRPRLPSDRRRLSVVVLEVRHDGLTLSPVVNSPPPPARTLRRRRSHEYQGARRRLYQPRDKPSCLRYGRQLLPVSALQSSSSQRCTYLHTVSIRMGPNTDRRSAQFTSTVCSRAVNRPSCEANAENTPNPPRILLGGSLRSRESCTRPS